jgi:hypothetical protein
VPQPRLYDSRFAETVVPPLPPPTAEPDLSISMRSLTVNTSPLPASSLPRVNHDSREDSKGSIKPDPQGSARGVEVTGTRDISDDDGGSTDYYTDQAPGSPLERSPSPDPVHPLAKNHSYEGHSGREEGPSSQSSQSTQKPSLRLSDGEGNGEGTPRAKGKWRERDDAFPKSAKDSSDEELEVLRSELSSQIVRPTPPRELRPDPYVGWSSAKRAIMVLMRSKAPGEEVDIRRVLGGTMSKLELR